MEWAIWVQILDKAVCVSLCANALVKYMNSALWVGLRICWLYSLLRNKTPLQKKKQRPGYDSKLHLIMRLQFWKFGICAVIATLPLLPGPLCSGVIITVMVPSIDETDLLKKLFIFVWNLWCHYNWIICIKNNYLQLYEDWLKSS